MRDNYVFLVGIFCLRFKFEIFNHERSERLKISNLNLKQTKKLKSQQQQQPSREKFIHKKLLNYYMITT